MGGLPSTVTNESIVRIHQLLGPRKNMTEAVTRDMASSDGLKLASPFFFFLVIHKLYCITLLFFYFIL